MASPSDDRHQRIDEAVGRFLTAEEVGAAIPPDEWLASEPDLRPELEQFLADRAQVREAFAEVTAEPADTGFEPGAEFDGLRVVRLLRVGGMGRVYEAVQLGLDRRVAVKAVPAGRCGEALANLVRAEGLAVARLTHPHIVPVYGCGEREGRPYLVMRLMDGSLKDRLTAGPLRPREAAQAIRAIALSAQYAHDHGFLHRDIKPSNVLLDARGTPHLADFGLVVRASTAGGRAGTAGYMAPEQLNSAGRVSERTDVYGLGAVLYECLTGRPPGDPTATGWVPPVRPAVIRPGVDPRLETICLKCLAADPAGRYPTAAAVAREIDRYLNSPGRWIAAVVGVLAAVVFGIGVWASRPAREADPHAAERAAEFTRLLSAVKDRTLARPMGWTWANRDDLELTAALARDRDAAAVRSELARTFASHDLRPAGEFAHGVRYEVAAFRPGTGGRQVALGVHWRADGDLTPIRVDLFDRNENRVVRSWEVPLNPAWESRREARDGVRGMAFAPAGGWLAVGTRGGGVYVLDADDEAAIPRRLVQEREPVKHLFPTADGTALLTLSLDGKLRRWRVGEWVQEAEVELPTYYPNGWEFTAAVVPTTGDLWVSAPHEGRGTTGATVYRFTGRLVKLDEQAFPQLIRLPAPHPHAPVVMVSADGEQAFTPEQLALGTPPAPGFSAGLDRFEQRNGFLSDGGLYYTGTDSPLVKFWDAAGFTPTGQVKFAGGNGYLAAAPDAPLVAITDGDCVRLYERSGGGPERRVGFDPRSVHAVGLTPDAGTPVTASAEGLSYWRVADGNWRGTRADMVYAMAPAPPAVLPAVGTTGFAVSAWDGLWVVSDDRPPRNLSEVVRGDLRQVDPFGRAWVWRDGAMTAGGGEWCHPAPRGGGQTADPRRRRSHPWGAAAD